MDLLWKGMNLFLTIVMVSFNQENTLKKHYLYPAELFASKEHYIIDTILGSCVAVCLYDPILKIGGMNHYMLPLWNANGLASPKYGNIAIEKLVKRMLEFGSSINTLQAKVFGGGEVVKTENTYFKIGERNIDVAKNMLAEYSISIVSISVGGQQGRKLRFDTKTGVVLMKYIQNQEMQ